MSLVPALLSAGIGLRAGPYGPAVRAVATGLLVLAALGSVVALWAELRRTRRRRRTHLFERGLVVTGPEPPLACAWHDVRVIERRQTVGDPRTGRYTQRWMVLSTRGGDRLSAPGDARFLCKLKATSPAAASVHRAMRGSAGA
ncbi:hypothetical protein E1265_29450 [Streptomyces sp. 8K308]|uniref:hypothetical protein n=1 Tax=Streptomyces sp. 8K308 TaxID=2530388 RepID=UPI00104DB2F2|nr:hypothetical protein [Streptomyces sp. 8K308]TDC12659.1 hypothetical protein E1265_29450 [Streptomyces sp. 8K308]